MRGKSVRKLRYVCVALSLQPAVAD